MTFRRRLALLLDPSLAPPAAAPPEPVQYDLYDPYGMDMARALERIAKSLERIDRKTAKRRPRIVECQHPELHPELEAA